MAKQKRRTTVLLVPPRGAATNLRPAGAHDDETVYDRKKQKAALRREIAESGFPRSSAALVLLAFLAACSGGGPAASPLARSNATAVEAARAIGVTGTGSDAALDQMVEAFMLQQRVPNAQLAVSSGGKTVFSHAYTFTKLAASTTTTQTIMRLASNSKAWVSAALLKLITRKKISPSAKVFPYLGITTPLPSSTHPDPRVYDITIQNMIDHKSGWDDAVAPYYDPTFEMRRTALQLGLRREITQTEYVRHQLGMPLQQVPGSTYAYCNFCYTVLGMVVAKASHASFADFLASDIAAPLHLKNVELSPTAGARLSNEVARYYSPLSGLSAIDVTSQEKVPNPYGGDGMSLEIAQGASAVTTSAESMLALMNHYLIWGVGKPQPGADWAREGSMDGTSTWAEQLPNGKNFAFLANTRTFSNQYVFEGLQAQIESALK
jgi:CubicO group peptidase (beta-lactamase class C family)